MASEKKTPDLDDAVWSVIEVELKLLESSVDSWQVYLNQASRASSLAAATLQEVHEGKTKLSEAARRIGEFGRENSKAYSDLGSRLSSRYFDALEKIIKKNAPEGADGPNEPDEPDEPPSPPSQDEPDEPPSPPSQTNTKVSADPG